MDLFDDSKVTSTCEKDKHATIRVLLQESANLGKYVRTRKELNESGPDDVPLLFVFTAMYVVELEVLCVEAKVISTHHQVPPSVLSSPMFQVRELLTGNFPLAVRQSVALFDELKMEMLEKLKGQMGSKFQPSTDSSIAT